MKTFKTLLLLAALAAPAYADKVAKYELSFTNITKGQVLSPAAIITHNGYYKLFEIGQAATPGLYMLAEDGATAQLKVEAEEKGLSFQALDGLTFPGETKTIIFEASPKQSVSIASMLARTNDGFASSLRPISLYLRVGQETKRVLTTFDAGSELNNELQAYIPAFGNPGVRTESGEGFVSFHPGLQGVGDLDLQAIAFAPQSALVKIKRIE